MKRKNIICFLIVIIALVIILVLFLPKNKTDIDHVFLITIDTLRADHLGCHDYPRPTTPFLDSIAQKGILFRNAYSQSASTCPSHASIMTGLYPTEHRVLANGFILNKAYHTLAELLFKNGFKTAAFTSTDRHFLASNINQGFQFYEEPEDTVKTYGFKYRPARLTIDNAIIWLDNFNPAKKLFIWIHLFDPHLPYNPAENYLKLIKDSTSSKEYLKYLEKRKINLDVFENDREKLLSHMTKYDAEIRYTDQEIKRFFNLAQKKGLNKNSLWIITGDHGEGLGQHNWLQHAFYIYQEEIHVPLIFYSDLFTKSRVITDTVENCSIFYTLLDLLDIGPKAMDPAKLKRNSLLDYLSVGYSTSYKKFAFSESERYRVQKPIKELKNNQTPSNGNTKKYSKYGLQFDNFKYIHIPQGMDQFYHLTNDPFELENLRREKGMNGMSHMLQKKILKILKDMNKFLGNPVKRVNQKTRNRLKSLGYIE